MNEGINESKITRTKLPSNLVGPKPMLLLRSLHCQWTCPALKSVVKLVIEDVRKLIHLYYIKIGAPLPEDWHDKGGTIWRTIAALEMTANKCRKVETIIYTTYHSLHNGEIYNKSKSSRQNETAIANGSKIQQLVADYRETGLSYSETMTVINLYCIESNIPTVTCSAVVSCEKRMVKVILPIIK